MNVLQVCALALLAAMLSYLLRTAGSRLAVLVSLCGGLALLALTLARYREPIAALREMAERTGAGEEVRQIFKMLSVGMVCAAGADTCRDLGEATLAARLEFFGRGEILLLALPFLLRLFSFAWEAMA